MELGTLFSFGQDNLKNGIVVDLSNDGSFYWMACDKNGLINRYDARSSFMLDESVKVIETLKLEIGSYASYNFIKGESKLFQLSLCNVGTRYAMFKLAASAKEIQKYKENEEDNFHNENAELIYKKFRHLFEN